MIFHRMRPQGGQWTAAQRVARNRRDKKDLVGKKLSHGVLVYSNGEPVGWCQYGPRAELPRVDPGRRYRQLSLKGDRKLWRITCFWVDRKYRHRGVATLALKAALDSIRKKGGGLVEAYPAKRKGFPADWFGTLSMFRDEGFGVVAPFGKGNVFVRRTI